MSYMKVMIICLVLRQIKAGTEECGIIKLSNTAITADMSKAYQIDEKNFDPRFATLDNDKAFCAKVEPHFFIQINFGMVQAINNIVVQGYHLNGTGLMLYAFVLQMSLDGENWYTYYDTTTTNHIQKYFMIHFASSGKKNEKIDFPLDAPLMVQYMRIVPHWPMAQIEHQFCIRLQFTGCNAGNPPKVYTPDGIATKIGYSSTMKCVAEGQVGVSVKWKGRDNTFVNTSNVQSINRNISSTLAFSHITYGDLPAFQCTMRSSYIHCIKTYTCTAYYSFDPRLYNESRTIVSINITLPNRPTKFSVQTKNESGVLLSWTVPRLNDFDRSMLEYVFRCNISGRMIQNIYSLNKESTFLFGLGIYKPYTCYLTLQLNKNSRKFVDQLEQLPVITHFHSLTIRPNVKPYFVLENVSPDGMSLIDLKVNFSKVEYGKLAGFAIQAIMIYYGNRDPQLSSVINTTFSRNIQTRDNHPTSFAFKGLKPWSVYNVSVAAFNNDNLYSNKTFITVRTPEGKPATGPDLQYFHGTSSSLLLNIESSSFQIKDHNGIITCFQCMLNPDNKQFIFEAKSKIPFEFTHLQPYAMYKIKCRAKTLHGFGPFGNVFEKRTLEGNPSAPKDISILSVTDTSNLLLRWSAPQHENGNVSTYEVQIILVNHTQLSFLATSKQMKLFEINIPKDFVSKVTIRASNGAGTGPWSRIVHVRPSVTSPTVPSENKAENIVMITAFSVAIVFLLLLVLLCFMHYRRRYSSHRLYMKENCMHIEYIAAHRLQSTHDEDNTDEDTLLVQQPIEVKTEYCNATDQNITDYVKNCVAVKEFAEYMNEAKQDEYEMLLEEFKSKLMSGKCYTWQVADRPENGPKNRYTDIAAYDHSRVILKHDCKRKTSDYVNASTLCGFNYAKDSTCRYISTQGPTPNVLGEFWLMVWQEEISVIVMLTNLKENDKIKCAQYWPCEGCVKYGSINVGINKIEKTADYIIRTFAIEKTGTKEIRTVRQFHFVSWPDHGAPDYPTAILSLRRRVKHYHQDNKPILVHCRLYDGAGYLTNLALLTAQNAEMQVIRCTGYVNQKIRYYASAGVGRSGCFILIDAMLERIDKEGNVDIFNYLRYMRSRRINMVQTFEQYIFAHHAILEYITFGNTEIIVDDLDRRTRELIRGSGMINEFSILNRNAQPDPYIGNVFKVFLSGGKFVEAYKVDGYKHRDAFILTTAPTKESIDDFWRMVLEKQCHTIVRLNKCQETSQEYFKYWPDLDGECLYGDITVSLHSEVASGNIITRKIKLISSKSRCEVHHFQYVGWPDSDIPNRRAYNNLCTLMQAVEKSQQNLGNGPIIVHAGNDYGRSGTFVAVYNSIERLKVEQLIDVLQCVRAIRISQPLAVDNARQYQFVYNMLRTYLEGFENYWNYKDYKICRSPLSSTTSAT